LKTYLGPLGNVRFLKYFRSTTQWQERDWMIRAIRQREGDEWDGSIAEAIESAIESIPFITFLCLIARIIQSRSCHWVVERKYFRNRTFPSGSKIGSSILGCFIGFVSQLLTVSDVILL